MGQDPEFGELVPLGGTKFNNAFWFCTCMWSLKMVDGPLGHPAEGSYQHICVECPGILVDFSKIAIQQLLYGLETQNGHQKVWRRG